MNITGTEIAYLHICRRKLWLSRHGIRMEFENNDVQIGRQVHENAFKREGKDIKIGDVGVVDFADFKDGIIHETKKGRTPQKGDVAQVRYYLWYLRKHGIRADEAQIHYPLLRRISTVAWDEECEKLTEEDLTECAKVVSMANPPAVEKKPYCKSCAYWELCML